jgi:hypothetical protein
MAQKDWVSLEGSADLQKALADLAKVFDGPELAGLCLKGAREVRDEAKRLAPKGPGQYKKTIQQAIVAQRGKKVSKFGASALCRVNFKDSPEAWWTEFGTKERKAKGGGVLRVPLSLVGARRIGKRTRLGKQFGFVFTKTAAPMKAQHWFKRAAQSKIPAAREAVLNGAKDLVLKAAKKK